MLQWLGEVYFHPLKSPSTPVWDLLTLGEPHHNPVVGKDHTGLSPHAGQMGC